MIHLLLQIQARQFSAVLSCQGVIQLLLNLLKLLSEEFAAEEESNSSERGERGEEEEGEREAHLRSIHRGIGEGIRPVEAKVREATQHRGGDRVHSTGVKGNFKRKRCMRGHSGPKAELTILQDLENQVHGTLLCLSC